MSADPNLPSPPGTDDDLRGAAGKPVRRQPAQAARLAIDVLRASARTGDVRAAIQLRALSAYADPEGYKTRQNKATPRHWANYMRLCIEHLRDERGFWPESPLLEKIRALPHRPRENFEAWFHCAWSLYMESLDHDLKNDPIALDRAQAAIEKAATTKAHSESYENNIARRYKSAAKAAWSVKSPLRKQTRRACSPNGAPQGKRRALRVSA